MASTNIGGSVTPNRNGSNDGNLNITRSIGDERANAAVGAFVAGNDHRAIRDGTLGAFANANANGHGASMVVSHTPRYNMTTVDAAATANVWTSANKATSVNLNANASQHVSGPLRGHKNFGYGIGFSHRF